MRSALALSLVVFTISCSQKAQQLEISQSGKAQSATSDARVSTEKRPNAFSKIPQAGAPGSHSPSKPKIIEDVPVVKRPEVPAAQPSLPVVLPPEPGIEPKNPEPPMLVNFREILSEADFEKMFPERNAFYTYAALSEAVDELDAFAKTGDLETRKREVAALLGNVGHETGDLKYIREQGSAPGQYTDPMAPATPGVTREYMGRGPLQLKWRDNYRLAGEWLGMNLVEEPDLIEKDPKIAWKIAIWYWIFSKGDSKMSAHEAITKGAGFGETIRAINRTGECRGVESDPRIQGRITRYKKFTQLLGIAPGEKLGC